MKNTYHDNHDLANKIDDLEARIISLTKNNRKHNTFFLFVFCIAFSAAALASYYIFINPSNINALIPNKIHIPAAITANAISIGSEHQAGQIVLTEGPSGAEFWAYNSKDNPAAMVGSNEDGGKIELYYNDGTKCVSIHTSTDGATIMFFSPEGEPTLRLSSDKDNSYLSTRKNSKWSHFP